MRKKSAENITRHDSRVSNSEHDIPESRNSSKQEKNYESVKLAASTQCLNDPQIIFASKESNSNLNYPLNDARQEPAQYRIRSQRVASLKHQSSGTTTPSMPGNQKSADYGQKARQTNMKTHSGTIKSAGAKQINMSVLTSFKTPKLVEQTLRHNETSLHSALSPSFAHINRQVVDRRWMA